MRKLFYFFALSAIALGMASCGDEPEAKNFNIKITKVSDTSVKVEFSAVDENMYYTVGCAESETFLKDPKAVPQAILDNYKEDNNPTYPEGLLHYEVERTFNDLDANKEYAIYVCEVDQNYKVVGKVEYKLVKGGEEPEQTEFKVIGLPDAFVKCDISDNEFASVGSLRFYFFTNSEWFAAENGGFTYEGGDGKCMEVVLYPKDRKNYSGSYTVNQSQSAWRYELQGADWVIDGSDAKPGGTINVTRNADKSYTFELDLSFNEYPAYKGTITGIREK